jgi:DNA-directed RNA polymerase specialized sigma subunit
LIEDKHAGPDEIARTRIDFSDWLDSLKRRDRKVAEVFAKGETTKTAAKRFKVSAGRISQLRREFAANWRAFLGDDPGPAAANAA